MDVGDAGEAGGQALADGGLAGEAAADRLRAARGEEDRVIGEEGHDRVQVVPVEGIGDGLDRGERGHRLGHYHPRGQLGRCLLGGKVSIANQPGFAVEGLIGLLQRENVRVTDARADIRLAMLVHARDMPGRPIPDALIVGAALAADAVPLATFDAEQRRFGIGTREP